MFALVSQGKKVCVYHNLVLRGPRRNLVPSAGETTVESELREANTKCKLSGGRLLTVSEA